MVRKMPAIGKIADSDTPLDHLKDPGRKLGGGQADLLADLAHLLVDRIKHPGQVAHDPADQYLLEPTR